MQLTPSGRKLDRLTIYSFMLAVANIFHQLCFWSQENLILDTLLFLFALALLFRPGSVILLIILTTLRVINGYLLIPFINNHMFFQTIIDLLVMLSVSYVLLLQYKKGTLAGSLSNEVIRDEMFDAFAPVARMALIILYFFAIFHKLNWTFFDPKYSPSVELLKDTFRFVPNLHLGNEIRIAAIWSTFLFEGGIAILLCIKHTRTIGLLVALLFHLCLTINPYWVPFCSFSSMLYSILFMFTPRDFPDKISQLFNSINHQWAQGKGRVLLWIGAVVVLILLVAACLAIYIGRSQNAITVLFVLWWLIIATVFLSVMASSRNTSSESSNIFYPRWSPQWIVPIILFFNGMNPYLGLKTAYSFNLFTGLRTEGGKTNHFFMPQWLKIARYQDDLVQILATNNPEFIKYNPKSGLFLTYFDFQRLAGKKYKDFFVEYKRNGKPLRLEVKNFVYNDPEVLKPHSWFANKFLAFKPISSLKTIE